MRVGQNGTGRTEPDLHPRTWAGQTKHTSITANFGASPPPAKVYQISPFWHVSFENQGHKSSQNSEISNPLFRKRHTKSRFGKFFCWKGGGGRVSSRSKWGFHKRGINDKVNSPILGQFVQQFLREIFTNRPDHGYPFCGDPFGPCRAWGSKFSGYHHPLLSKIITLMKLLFWILGGSTVTVSCFWINSHHSYSFVVLLSECSYRKEFPSGIFNNYM